MLRPHLPGPARLHLLAATPKAFHGKMMFQRCQLQHIGIPPGEFQLVKMISWVALRALMGGSFVRRDLIEMWLLAEAFENREQKA